MLTMLQEENKMKKITDIMKKYVSFMQININHMGELVPVKL